MIIDHDHHHHHHHHHHEQGGWVGQMFIPAMSLRQRPKIIIMMMFVMIMIITIIIIIKEFELVKCLYQQCHSDSARSTKCHCFHFKDHAFSYHCWWTWIITIIITIVVEITIMILMTIIMMMISGYEKVCDAEDPARSKTSALEPCLSPVHPNMWISASF